MMMWKAVLVLVLFAVGGIAQDTPTDATIEIIDGALVLNSARDVMFNITGNVKSLNDLALAQVVRDALDSVRRDLTAGISSANSRADSLFAGVSSAVVSASESHAAALSSTRSSLTSTLTAGDSTVRAQCTSDLSVARSALQAQINVLQADRDALLSITSAQTSQLAVQSSTLATLSNRVNTQSSTLTQQSTLISSLSLSLDNQVSSLATAQAAATNATAAIVAELLPRAPVLTLRDNYARSLTFTWPAPLSYVAIRSYEAILSDGAGRALVSRSVAVDVREVTFDSLNPNTRYVITVAAVTGIGQGARGIWNGTTINDEISGFAFSCRPAGWSVTAATTNTLMCSATVALRGKSIIKAMITGHINCATAGAIYAAVFVDEDMAIMSQELGPGYSVNTNAWETMSTQRVRVVDKIGNVEVRAMVASANGNCYINGAAMHGVVINVYSPNFQKFQCASSAGWSIGVQANWVTQSICEATFNLPTNALVYARFNGHFIVAANQAYGAINFNNDIVTRFGNAVSNQALAPAHTYTTTWETFGSGRSAWFTAGASRVGIAMSSASGATFNGGMMQGFSVETKRDRSFTCVPSAWSYTSNNDVVTLCTATVVIDVPAVMWTEFAGHIRITSGTCYGLISFNNDGAAPLAAYGGDTLQIRAPAHSYWTASWKSFSSGRAVEVPAGTHTASIQFRCSTSGMLNGAALYGYWFPRQ